MATISVPSPIAPGVITPVTGAGFDPRKKLQLAVDSVGYTSNYFRARQDGSFQVGISVGSSIGAHVVTARYSGSTTIIASAVVQVQVPAPPPPPPPPPPPTSNIPAIPPGTGTVLRKDFADGVLAPFYATAYPEDPPHVAPGQLPGQMQPNQDMTQWTRYRNALTDKTLLSVHDGVLDLVVRRRPDGSGFWDGSFVTTGEPTPKFSYQYGKVRWAAQLPGPTGPADWRTIWQLVDTSWTSPEIDWPEVIGGRATANLHGPDISTGVSVPLDTNWHIWGVDKYPTYIEFFRDGVSLKKITTAMTAQMGLLADAKVGLATPTTATPDEMHLLIAWVTVDP